ncbi:riboflavin kinase [Ureibacillus sp. FSL W7-1570]|uniref:riboflavin kinase n=1 Tax=Ureibacillus sp. FSL W7-1570 TaxID=2954593 RepID=UPI00315ABF95
MNALSHPRERFIVGQVKKGKQLGKQLGFPTANLNTLGEIKLEGGVYGVFIYIEKRKYAGIMNIGTRPTFNDGNHQTVEVHIFDFHENLYGKYLTVEPAFFVRKEKKFNGIEELIGQIEKDVLYARSQFQSFNGEGGGHEKIQRTTAFA